MYTLIIMINFLVFLFIFSSTSAWSTKVRILTSPSPLFEESPKKEKIELNTSLNKCIYDSDCLNDLVCKWGQCVSVCKNSKDCKDGEFCAQKYKYGEVIPAFFSTTICIKKVSQSEWMENSPLGAESFQVGWNYWGGEYRDFPLKEENPLLCYKSCKEDASCFSWTYSRSGNHSDAPYCFLKSKIGPGASNSSLISGAIVR